MKPEYPHSIRHRKAFQAWITADRKVSAEVLKVAKRRDPQTIYNWRDAEGWVEFADHLDGAESLALVRTQEEHATAALAQANDAVSVMLNNTVLMNTALAAVLQKQSGASLDEFTVQAIGNYSKASIDSASKLYGWERLLKVEHTVKADLSINHYIAIQARLIEKVPEFAEELAALDFTGYGQRDAA